MDLAGRVERLIEHHRLFSRKDSIVVAVSGGPDSAALLHILLILSAAWEWRLIVAHMNHGFRGEESDAEEAFVARWTADLQLPCEIGRCDVPGYAAASGQNPQLAAREKRYEFLRQTCFKYGAPRIALAHHADDQAETVLMRLIQGAGPAGLAGIPLKRTEKKVELIRPLLRIYKSEILDYCREQGIEYRVDSSNLSRKYTRNRIRLDLLPELTRYNPQIASSLNRLAETMRGEEEYMAQRAEEAYARLVTADERGFSLSRRQFADLPPALQRRVVKLILDCLALETGADGYDGFEGIERFREAILRNDGGHVTYPINGRTLLSCEYGIARFHRVESTPGPYDLLIGEEAGTRVIPEANAVFTFTWYEAGSFAAEVTGDEAIFNGEQLEFPLHLRSRMPGDRIRVLGLNGSKKVKDIFIDDKIPLSRRNHLPLLADSAQRVLWIPGVRRSDHAVVTPETKRWLHVKAAFFIK
ncbi:MAG: tilS [Paenibacillaceae bacterium]|jgi:tRNA(Ile)-lysidine synthase|nr:tilS [Paenibacillaceae bacterium]